MQAAAVTSSACAPRALQSARPRARQFTASAPQRRASSSRQCAVSVRAEVVSPPTVADAKDKFVTAFKKPLPGLYSTVVQELLVQQHLFRWNKQYQYSPVTALGLVSIFDQVLGGLPEAERELVFTAFITALEEDPARYRKDAAAMEEWARGQSTITPDAAGHAQQQALAKVAAAVGEGKFLYTKFFAVGLFRLVELTGSKDPKTLTGLVKALGLSQERVNADLMTYKGVLSKLESAKEIMKEFLIREKKKREEREAEKAAKAAAKAAPAEAAPSESTA
ncbi:THYLAKOID chloroplastic [Micractinium conductrix]|uniref:THYLAKOID chloroplastic n=1 Tax=Micractinium conductrix TaxID=554055 RepID=A0A2P6VPR4_9CHLO|nr:THYLAKOID chloroplastic [Micractinium conductrix]|eukprot:PSC76070.1 THYLAKOID chloroplastic [Micractinium conductrix]